MTDDQFDNDDLEAHKPATKGKRFLKLASMTASVAGQYAVSRLQTAFRGDETQKELRADSHRKIGERIASTLGELKGAAMKLGQMASLGGDILPAEIAVALKKLQKEAPPMPFSVIAQQIETEFGATPQRLFKRFDSTPFASASIGQVHRAQTDDGREVVVKVQYPGVDSSVDSDLSHLKFALRASGLLRFNKQVMDRLFEEVRLRLHEELDYCNEAENVRLFRGHHRHQPFVVVPDVVGERSSKRVLTLTYEDGENINRLDNHRFSQQTRDRIGENLFRLTLSQLFDLKALQSDPNPANFAFREDGTVVLYDFGCVKRIEPTILDAWRNTIRGGLDEDYDAVESGLVALGARNTSGPPVEADYYAVWRDILLRPFLGEDPFDYGTSRIHEEVARQVPGILRRLSSFQPPVEVVFIDRVLAGHYWNLRTIRSRGRFMDLVRPYLYSD